MENRENRQKALYLLVSIKHSWSIPINLGSSLNAVVIFNFKVTHAALFALKTTTAFNEEPKKESLAWKAEENRKIVAKNSRVSCKNGVIFGYFGALNPTFSCGKSLVSMNPTERIG